MLAPTSQCVNFYQKWISMKTFLLATLKEQSCQQTTTFYKIMFKKNIKPI